MADIYRSADKVVIWLGAEENGSDLALSAMATLASKVQVDWNRRTITRACSEDTDSRWLKLNDFSSSVPFDDETYSSIAFLLERPWDKIFGVLHLMPEYARLGIQPDYNKSVAEVFLDVILRSIFNTKDADILSYRCEPLNKIMLDFTEVMTRFLKLLDLTEKVSEDFLWDCSIFLDLFYNNVVGRAFILTQKEGLIGMAPEACRENDCIVVLLGCQSPMVLRPTDDGSFLVVGECYVQGLMDGEALLGPLPSNWRRVSRFYEETKTSWDAFNDRDRGIWQVEDPRLGPLPEGWCEQEHPKQHLYARFRDKTTDVVDWHDPRLLPSSLRDRGVELQEFNLV
ncbi:MAG: hypothetical protein Q9185_004476 [Variospora sp. 1 TL-2023]